MIESILSVEFKDKNLLRQALTHPSFRTKGGDYERLEFLGDKVLGLIIAEELYKRFPQENEGELTKRMAGLICGEALMKVAQRIGLGEHILMANSEASSGGRNNKANLENTIEALIGAIYLDQGADVARSFVHKNWLELIENMQEPPKDPKSALQEWAQGRGLPLPEYEVVKTEGPSHAPRFEVKVTVQGVAPQLGEGNSKRVAEQEAAGKLLASLL